VKIGGPREAMRHGIAYVTEDRHGFGLVLPLSIASNLSLPALSRYSGPGGLLKRGEEAATAREYRDQLHIRAASIESPAGSLSGGNQQKVMLGKWLNTKPRVLILDEPTRGIDVGAKADVHRIVDDLAKAGMAVIMISSDLPEVLNMSDRVLVMREGRQTAVLGREEATAEAVLTAAMGEAGASAA
jgi:rhamnose transport system ATP-binding protein